MPDLPWYHAGLKFTCTQCGDCCSGTPGYVWVTNEEIVALAAATGMAVEMSSRQPKSWRRTAISSVRPAAAASCSIVASSTCGAPRPGAPSPEGRSFNALGSSSYVRATSGTGRIG